MNQSTSGADSSPLRRKTMSFRRKSYRAPSSPFQHWKFEDDKSVGRGFEASARKLAAGLRQLRFTEVSCGQELSSCPYDHARSHFELEESVLCSKLVSERATKWDPCCSNECDDESHRLYFRGYRVSTESMVSTLNDELMQARLCIRELDASRKSFKKRVRQLLRVLEEEKVLWERRESEKDRADIQELVKELGRERRRSEKVENLNNNLVNQLASAKLSTDQFMKTYEEKRRHRRLMERVCKELVNRIGVNKAELKAMKRESLKIKNELEEDRKMLQIAEVWREERVQMKLLDAKLTLEDKYSQVNKLITEVEMFLRSRFTTLDMVELRKAELILLEIKSLNIQDIEEFSCVPSKSNDMFSPLEERPFEGKEGVNEPYNCHIASSHYRSKKIPFLSNLNCLESYSSGEQEYAKGWKKASHGEDQGSCLSMGERHRSIERDRSGSECDDNASESFSDTDHDTAEVFPVSEHQEKQKPTSVSKRWRPCPSKVVLDTEKRELSNGLTSNPGTNADRRMNEHEKRHEDSSDGHLFPTDTVNPHITRGMKGCIEWPRAIRKNGLNTKLLEAKIESQRSQICHVLKKRLT